MNEDSATKLKDINEKIQDLIVDSLKTSEILYIRGDLINSYRAIKQVFYKIAPYDFNNKDYLVNITNQIDLYLDEIDRRDAKPDLHKIFVINKRSMELKLLIEEYLKLIPFCLKELNLYLRVIKRVDDPDELFSSETFTTNESLLGHKKLELATASVEAFIKCLTPRQVHDVHARLLTYRDRGGMESLEYLEGEDDE